MEFFDISADSIAAVPPPKRVPVGELSGLLNGGLEEGTVTLVYGREGIGKTTLVLQMATAAALAVPVLYATAEDEMDKNAVLRLAGRTGQGMGATGATVASVGDVVRAAEEKRSGLVIVDSLPAVAGKTADNHDVLRVLLRFARRTGVAVVAVMMIDTANRRAGGYRLGFAGDTVIVFERVFQKPEIRVVIGPERVRDEADDDVGDSEDAEETSLRSITVVKSRSGPEGSIKVRMTSSGLEPCDDKVDRAIAEALSTEFAAEDLPPTNLRIVDAEEIEMAADDRLEDES